MFDPISQETARPWAKVPRDWRRPSEPEGYTAYFDRQRGYGQILPRPAPDEIARFYEVDDYVTHEAPEQSQPARVQGFWARALVKLAWWRDHGVEDTSDWWRQTLGPAPLRILEIGCGGGRVLHGLAELGHDVLGIEPDPVARETAAALGLTVLPGLAEDLPEQLAGQRFDAILFFHVMEHCADPSRALAAALEHLAPDGQVIIEVPNSDCLGHQSFGPLWLWLDIPRHLNFFTAQSLAALVAAHGLTTAKTDYTGYVRTFRPEWAAEQAQIAKAFGKPAPSVLQYWAYLARTAFARPAQKYDSVRIIARPRA